MRAGRRSLVGAVGVLALTAGFLGAAPPAQAAEPTVPFISEIHYDNGGADVGEFVEVQIPPGTSAAGLSVVLYNGNGGASYGALALPADVTAPADRPEAVALDATGIQNGSPDGLALVSGATVVEFLSYEGSFMATNGAASGLTSTDILVAEAGTEDAGLSLSKVRNDAGSYVWTGPTANTRGALNSPTGPPADDAPAVTATTPTDGASGVSQSANLTVTFSEPVETGAGAFTLACGGTDQPLTVSGTAASRTLDPTSDLPTGSCTLTVHAASVTDSDTNDPPDAMAADKTVTFSTGTGCGQPYTSAHAIQGSGAAPAITGAVTTQGVVVGDYEGAQPALRGFYLQDPNPDADPATSEAVFVFDGGSDLVQLGDLVRVSGTAGDFEDQTQVTLPSGGTVETCSTGNTITPTPVTLPFASADFPERYEGMLVEMTQTLMVTEHFQLGRFGEVLMSSGGRLPQPTSILAPGVPAQTQQNANNLNQILFDDASQGQNPDPILFGRGGQPLSASNTLRGGDTATNTVGVMTYTWAGNSASPNAFRLRPINAMGGGVPNFQAANPRPTAAPARADGTTVRVAGMNLLNFFNTFDGLPDTVDNCHLGTLGGPTDCRGPDTQAEFDRQWPKTVAGIVGTGADVIGINEIENDGYGPDSAIQFLVDRLNEAGAGTYAFMDVDAETGQTDAAGTDAIKVGVLYKPAVVTPVGQTAVLNSTAFVNGGDGSPRSRPSIAQAFEENASGSRFVVDVNHLKSKGSACAAPDAGDGSGNCDQVRTNAATALAAWLDSDPTGIDDPDVLLVGDYNSYAMERPVKVLEDAGYTNLIRQRIGPAAYSYVFDGQWGYLDYAFGTASIQPQVAAVHEWHINADEPSVLDYNTDFKTANLQATLYAPDQFRISDHDPVIVDLALTPAAESSTTTLTVSPSSQVYGTQTPATWSAEVTLNRGGAPQGTVELLDGDTVVATSPVTDGSAGGPVPAFLAAGNHTLRARFVPADPDDATGSTSDPSAFSVTKAHSTTSVSVQVAKVKGKGGPQTFVADMTATVSLENGRAPVGTVTFGVDGVQVASAPVSGGTARAVATVSKGTHVVTATFTPTDTDNHVGSDSPPVTVRAK
jgi:predicted extracellular nuclease